MARLPIIIFIAFAEPLPAETIPGPCRGGISMINPRWKLQELFVHRRGRNAAGIDKYNGGLFANTRSIA
jgi:hypothetical protein